MSRTISFLIMMSSVCVAVFALSCSSPQNDESTPNEVESPPDPHDFSLPFELRDNRIFFEVRINEHGPYVFVLDSGFNTIIDTALASELGQHQESPPDDETRSVFRTRLESLHLGAATFRSLAVTVMDLSGVRDGNGFDRLDGIIGLGVLQQYIVTIEYGRDLVRLTDAARFEDGEEAAGSDEIPFEFDNRIPTIRAEIDGIEGRFWLDIGDRSNLTFTTPFVEEHLDLEGREVTEERTTGWGVRGPIKARLARFDLLRIGDLEIRDFVARLPDAQGGVFANSAVAGSIGNGLLRTHDLTIDYARQQLTFGERVQGPAPVDRSGLWFVRRERHLEVTEVVPGSPAADSGISTGDRIIAALGREGAELDAVELRTALCDVEREEATLTLAGNDEGAEPRTVVLTLQPD